MEPRSNAPGRPEARGRDGPRSRDVSTGATCKHRGGASPPGHLVLPGERPPQRPVVAHGTGESAPCPRGVADARERDVSRSARLPRLGWAEFPGPILVRIHPFDSMRFHVLLNSLFKVLCNFPSRYLSAIGLVPVFSLRWSLPPALGCIPKQPDSEEARRLRATLATMGLTPALGEGHDQEDSSARHAANRASYTPHFPRSGRGPGIRCWALPASLAVTEGILVSFFSSAY